MGQYYIPTILGKRYGISATLYSHDYGNGLKLMEHSYLGNNFVNAVSLKIYHQPMRVAWIGDYSDDYPDDDSAEREPYQTKLTKAEFMRIYEKVWSPNRSYKKIQPEPLGGFDDPSKFDGYYLINHSRNAYVDLGEYEKANGWVEEWTDRYGKRNSWRTVVHPLPLLTACGNGRGGGDYHGCYPDQDKVGTWAFDVIELASYKPVGFTKEIYNFKEG